jgi:DNA polymerase/3'-5' exonuclease PolX
LVNDIDLVLVPKDRYAVDSILMTLGKVKMSGMKMARVQMDSISLDVYYATPETLATLLLIRTGSAENNIKLCTIAKNRGWHLSASGDGLFNEKRERIAGDSEESIYEALGVPYQEPWQRR